MPLPYYKKQLLFDKNEEMTIRIEKEHFYNGCKEADPNLKLVFDHTEKLPPAAFLHTGV